MSAGTYNLVIEQGATFRCVLGVRDGAGAVVDYSTSVIRAMVRQAYTSALPEAEFSCSLDASGFIVIELTAVQTAALTANPYPACPFVWDLETETGGTVQRLLRGTVKITPEATK